jgi:hypothetical protein
MALAGWPTPQVGDVNNSRAGATGDFQSLAREAKELAGWPTPNAMEGGQTSRSGDRKDEALLGGIIRGLTPASSNAVTGSGGAYRLNPFFSLYLMGFPVSWGIAGILSCPKPKRR